VLHYLLPWKTQLQIQVVKGWERGGRMFPRGRRSGLREGHPVQGQVPLAGPEEEVHCHRSRRNASS